jgi:hypothetical protein
MLQTEIRAWICTSEPKVSLVLAIWAALIRFTPDFGKLKTRPGKPKRAVFPAPGIRAVKTSQKKILRKVDCIIPRISSFSEGNEKYRIYESTTESGMQNFEIVMKFGCFCLIMQI